MSTRRWSDGLRERLKGDPFVVGSDLHRLEMALVALAERDELIAAWRGSAVALSVVALEECAKIIAPNFPSLARNVIGQHINIARDVLAKADAATVPRGTSGYLNAPVKSATERALHIAVKALEKLSVYPGPHQVGDHVGLAVDELARIRVLVPKAGMDNEC